MKKIFTGLMVFVGLMSFAGCDKIEPEEYTVYDGAMIEWETGSANLPAVQRVYVEKYTGPRCSNCPTADVTLDAIHNDNVVIVSINHPTGQGTPYPNQPDMRTVGGTVWDNYFGINAIPAAYVNRDRSTQYLGDMANIGSAINEALATVPQIAIEVEAIEVNGSVYVITHLDYKQDIPDVLTLTVALVEDSVVYRQLLPDNSIDDNYAHNHMLRKVVTSYWGRDIEASGKKETKLVGSLNFMLPSDVELEHCHIVAFVSNKASRKVLNVASCEIQ